jgi:probable phosphoglycerate mutase
VILLARHGQTEFNAPPVRIQGSLDPPLNETGLEQARELAEEVAGLGLRALYTSDMQRARQTGAIVAERVGLEPIAEPRFNECGWGAWEGLLVEDIARDDPGNWEAWLQAGESFRFPSAEGKPGESLAEHMARTLAALEDVRHGPLPALVVCHGGTIRVAVAARHPQGLDAYHDFHPRNGELVPLEEGP